MPLDFLMLALSRQVAQAHGLPVAKGLHGGAGGGVGGGQEAQTVSPPAMLSGCRRVRAHRHRHPGMQLNVLRLRPGLAPSRQVAQAHGRRGGAGGCGRVWAGGGIPSRLGKIGSRLDPTFYVKISLQRFHPVKLVGLVCPGVLPWFS